MEGDLSTEEEHKYTMLDESNLAASVDWRSKGAVNSVQNQGHCGSCWAFSATTSLEGHHFQKTGKLIKLAEQQLVDCDHQSHGCSGGHKDKAMTYTHTKGMELSHDYSYQGKDGSCKWSSSKAKVHGAKTNYVKPKSVSALKAAIAQGVTAVSVRSSSTEFHHYNGGIMNSANCA